MQLKDEKEFKQLYRLVSLALREAQWDYSDAMDMAVIEINGQSLVFDKEQLEVLSELKQQLEKEIRYE